MDQTRTPLLILLMALAVASPGALFSADDDTPEAHIAATDMSNPDQVFALASWFKEHQRLVSAQKYFKEVLRLDPDHAGARDALGFVRVNDKWVPKAFAPAGSQSATPQDPGGGPSLVSAPGPTADQVVWNASLPADPNPTDPFITKYIDRLPTVANDSQEMDVSVATCSDRKYWPSALPRLCQALARPDFNDLFGASNMVMELVRQGRLEEARPLLPYLVKASSHVTDPEDIEGFCYAAAAFHDRRAVPRLIELIETGNAQVAQAAGEAVSAIGHLPPSALDAAHAHAWWNDNWNRSETESLRAQLLSKDDFTAVEAAKALYGLRDRSMMETAIRCLGSSDLKVRKTAVDLIAACTGDGWGFNPEGADADRAKVILHIQAWWKENRSTFAFKDAGSAATPTQSSGDPCADLVGQLDRAEGTVATEASANLRARGTQAVPALIDGLGSSSAITRRRCSELLATITSQSIAFDAHGSDEDRAAAVKQWRDWWDANKPAAAPVPSPPVSGTPGTPDAPSPHPAPPGILPGM